jgi:hypothetical protein
VARFVIILVLAAVAVGLLWPMLIRLRRGRVSGNVISERRRGTYLVPIATCVVLSFVISAALWWLGH